jgi:hypothetical protein
VNATRPVTIVVRTIGRLVSVGAVESRTRGHHGRRRKMLKYAVRLRMTAVDVDLGRPPPILLTWMPRSGTAWVGPMLTARGEVGSIGEPSNLSASPGYCAFPADHWYAYVTTETENRYLTALAPALEFDYPLVRELRRCRYPTDLDQTLRSWRDFVRALSHTCDLVNRIALLWRVIYSVVADERFLKARLVRPEELSRDPVRRYAQPCDALGLKFTDAVAKAVEASSSSENPAETTVEKPHETHPDLVWP